MYCLKGQKKLIWHAHTVPTPVEIVTLTSCYTAILSALLSLWAVSGDFKDFIGSAGLSCVPGLGKLRENQVKPQQSTSDIKSLIVIGVILRDYSTIGYWDRMENCQTSSLRLPCYMLMCLTALLYVPQISSKCACVAVLEMQSKIREGRTSSPWHM